jgi:phosphoribosylformylglycinamidine cyclo-ligase
MTTERAAKGTSVSPAYKAVGVDTSEAESGLQKIIARIKTTWPESGFGKVELDIGYFANVVRIDDRTGIAVCTDGVGTKTVIAQMTEKYDTIGIDCVAMNVNDLICVGATPVSLVDYIGIQKADARVLDQIAVGLAAGAAAAGISISGGEIAQLSEIITGFDLVGAAVGRVELDKILVGQDVREGDAVIGIESNGLHSNGFTLARRAFFQEGRYKIGEYVDDLGATVGDELLRPTHIYVRECLEILRTAPSVKAFINITSDGLNNLTRVKADASFEIHHMPDIPPVFRMIERLAGVSKNEMFEVYNMGVGFCIIAGEDSAERIIAILRKYNRNAQRIGYAVADGKREVRIPAFGLRGEKKAFISDDSGR